MALTGFALPQSQNILPKTFAVSPVVQSCSSGVTSPTTAAMLSCTLGSSVTNGNMIVGIITCYGCSINANPINNDSKSFIYHAVVENCCAATGAAQISSIFAANATSGGTDTISAQIRDTVNRTTWLMSAFEVDATQVSNLQANWVTGAGYSGVASTVAISSTAWSYPNSLVFEGADSDNGLQPVCTAGFTSGPTNAANQHCYAASYSNSNSPSTFPMGTFGGATSMSEVVLIMKMAVTPVTTRSMFHVSTRTESKSYFNWWKS